MVYLGLQLQVSRTLVVEEAQDTCGELYRTGALVGWMAGIC